MSGYATERQVIESRWQAQWVDGGAPRTPTQYEGVPFTVPRNGEYARLTVTNGETQIVGLGAPGANLNRCPGVIGIQLYTQAGKGTHRARELADLAAAVFRSQAFSGVQTFAATVRVSGDFDGWTVATVTIPFYRHDYY